MYTTYRRENVLPQDTGGLTNQCSLYEYQIISSVRHRHDTCKVKIYNHKISNQLPIDNRICKVCVPWPKKVENSRRSSKQGNEKYFTYLRN